MIWGRIMKIGKIRVAVTFISAACILLMMSAAGFADVATNGGAPIDIAALKRLYERPKDIPYPADDPYSKAKAVLGKTLFFDPRISASGTQSCATCHNPAFSWSDGMGLAVGSGHKRLGRKSPTILNLAWDQEAESYMWDGRKVSLEDQATGPMFSAAEMGTEPNILLAKLKSIPSYQPLFNAAFPDVQDPITADYISKAIATYERTVISGTAPFDRWLQGDEKAISESAKQGFILFNQKARCSACHSGWRFSDGGFHDIGLDDEDLGRGKLLPNLVSMQHAFKAVGLRNIALRSPYMHNGSLKTLAEVVDHYDHGFVKRPSLADDIRPLHLTAQEKADLIAFLKTLTSKDAEVTIPTMPR
jgi:cytochrome c peroxidase